MSFTLRPAEGRDFINRENIISDIVSTLENPDSLIGFALYGKRRVGKTSIFREVQRILKEKKNVIPVYLSLWELAEDTVEEFVQALTVSVLEAYGPNLSLKHKAKNLLEASFSLLKEITRELKISVNLKDDIEFLLTFDRAKKPNVNKIIEMAFNLPERLANETKTKCVLFIDEFPSIIDLKNGKKLGEGVVRKVRTIHETQKKTVLCISGSIRKTMQAVALSPVSAFYRQFAVKEILPLEQKDIKKLIERNLKQKITAEILDLIYNFSGGIPFYVQAVGRELSRSGAKKLTPKIVEDSIDTFFKEEGNIIFKEEFTSLSDKERAIVIAMAKENISAPSEIAEKIGYALNSVAVFLGYLLEKGVLSKEEKGVYWFEDPVFKKWLKLKY